MPACAHGRMPGVAPLQGLLLLGGQRSTLAAAGRWVGARPRDATLVAAPAARTFGCSTQHHGGRKAVARHTSFVTCAADDSFASPPPSSLDVRLFNTGPRWEAEEWRRGVNGHHGISLGPGSHGNLIQRWVVCLVGGGGGGVWGWGGWGVGVGVGGWVGGWGGGGGGGGWVGGASTSVQPQGTCRDRCPQVGGPACLPPPPERDPPLCCLQIPARQWVACR